MGRWVPKYSEFLYLASTPESLTTMGLNSSAAPFKTSLVIFQNLHTNKKHHPFVLAPLFFLITKQSLRPGWFQQAELFSMNFIYSIT